MIHRSTPSAVAAALFLIPLYQWSIQVSGVVQVDSTSFALHVARYLRENRKHIRVSRTGRSYRLVVHATFWRNIQTSVAFYEPYSDEKSLKRRLHGKTFRGTVTEENLLHALRWVKSSGKNMGQFNVYWPINEQNARYLMKMIEERVAHAQ